MFDRYVFTENSARNVLTASGDRAFQLETLITYYRGIPLSMVHDVELVLDDRPVPREDLLISPDGSEWFTLEEAATVTTYRWEYGTPLYVRRSSALEPGEHEVTLRLRIRVAYIPIPFGGERTRTVTV